MDAPTLKPGFGPTLGELLAPRWRSASRGRRRVLTALAVLLASGVAAIVILYPRDGWVVHRSRVISFSLQYAKEMHRVRPHAGEFARLEGGGASFALAPLRLPAYRGEVSGVEPLYANSYIAALAARTRGFRLQSEGKTRGSATSAYTFTYAFDRDSEQWFGRVVFLTSGLTRSRDGVTMTMTIRPSAADPTADQVSVADVLQEPVRTFRFGA